MAEAAARNLNIPNWVLKVNENRALMVPIGLISLLAVILVPLPPMVIDVRVVHERRDQERDAAQQVPDKAKRGQAASCALMDHLVDEHRAAIEQQAGREEVQHLLKMLSTTRQSLSDEEIDQLVSTID